MGPVDWCEHFVWSVADTDRLSATWEDIFVLLDNVLFEKQVCVSVQPVLSCSSPNVVFRTI